MKNTNTRIFSVLLIAFSLIFNGCAYQIGKIIEDRKPDREIINREEYNTIKILSEISVYKVDLTITKGRLIEITEEYLTL